MPQELLSFPPYYTLVGIYRLLTDHPLRAAVWAKVKHATVRGLLVSSAYAVLTWPVQRWFARTFLLGGWGLFKGLAGKPPPVVVTKSLGWLREIDMLEYTTLLLLLPQLSSLLTYFLRRNLLLAKSRAWDLTVASRGKPAEFWGRGYVEEWEVPPRVGSARGIGGGRWVGWVLWWPSQVFLRHFILIPLSPYLPLLNLALNASLRALHTSRSLHTPYFSLKKMNPAEIEVWLEERKWGYLTFGFTASLLERLPIIGLLFSVTNRIGAAMWAFDLEKRQHEFAAGLRKPLKPGEVGGTGVEGWRTGVVEREREREGRGLGGTGEMEGEKEVLEKEAQEKEVGAEREWEMVEEMKRDDEREEREEGKMAGVPPVLPPRKKMNATPPALPPR